MNRHLAELPGMFEAAGEQGVAAGAAPSTDESRILVTGGSAETFAEIADLLRRAGLRRTSHAPTAEAGLRRLAALRHDACLVTATLPEGAAAGFLARARGRGLMTPMLLLATSGEATTAEQALEAGFTDLLEAEELDAGRLAGALRLAIARERLTERLDHQARHDELTGLANRALLRDRLERALAGARRHGCAVAVVLLDLNGFKAVNDRLGHAAGDELLAQVGRRLRARVRETDTVARLGGDEFALVLENLARPEHAAIVVRKLLETMAAPVTLADGPAEVTASLGVALYPDDGAEPGALLSKADAAMYEAKAAGGNACRFHDAGLGTHLRRSAILGSDLRRALEEQRFLLRFQPQLALVRGTPPALSARPTLAHDELGPLGMEQFGGLAEEIGLVEPLNDWLLTAACAQARLWQDAGLAPFLIGVPVLSRRQLSWTGLAGRVRERVQEFGLQRHLLELELAERLLIEQREEATRALGPLRQLGVGVAVEAFGLECGALRLLRELPLSTLKLARALLEPGATATGQRRFARVAIGLGQALGLKVVTYGPLSASEMRVLREEGCEAVQGALDAMPIEAEAAAAWLEAAALAQPGAPG